MKLWVTADERFSRRQYLNNRDSFSDAIFGSWTWNPATTDEVGYYTGRYGDEERHFSPYAVAQIEGLAGGDLSSHEDFRTDIASKEGEDPDKQRNTAPPTGEIAWGELISPEEGEKVTDGQVAARLNNHYKDVVVNGIKFQDRYKWIEEGGAAFWGNSDRIVLLDVYTGEYVEETYQSRGTGGKSGILIGAQLAEAGEKREGATAESFARQQARYLSNLAVMKPWTEAKKRMQEDEKIPTTTTTTGGSKPMG